MEIKNVLVIILLAMLLAAVLIIGFVVGTGDTKENAAPENVSVSPVIVSDNLTASGDTMQKNTTLITLIGTATETVPYDTASFEVDLAVVDDSACSNESGLEEVYVQTEQEVIDILGSYGINKSDMSTKSFYEGSCSIEQDFIVRTGDVENLTRMFYELSKNNKAVGSYSVSISTSICQLGLKDATKKELSRKLRSEALQDAVGEFNYTFGDSGEIKQIEDRGLETRDSMASNYDPYSCEQYSFVYGSSTLPLDDVMDFVPETIADYTVSVAYEMAADEVNV